MRLNLKIVVLLSVVSILLFASNGCEKDDVETIYPTIYKYDIKSMFYPGPIIPDTTVVELVYDKNNRIVHRIGNLLSTGVMYQFYDEIGDTLIYYNDSIIIMKHVLSDEHFSSVNPRTRKLILNNGIIIKEINRMAFYGNINSPDTLLYFYNEKNQIDRTIHSYLASREYSNYHFDEKGNLSLITSETYLTDHLGNSQMIIDSTWFLDYDTAPNLAKELIIFEECFFRALSTNNFRKYVKKSYWGRNAVMPSIEERSWDLLYDENNYPIY